MCGASVVANKDDTENEGPADQLIRWTVMLNIDSGWYHTMPALSPLKKDRI